MAPCRPRGFAPGVALEMSPLATATLFPGITRDSQPAWERCGCARRGSQRIRKPRDGHSVRSVRQNHSFNVWAYGDRDNARARGARGSPVPLFLQENGGRGNPETRGAVLGSAVRPSSAFLAIRCQLFPQKSGGMPSFGSFGHASPMGIRFRVFENPLHFTIVCHSRDLAATKSLRPLHIDT
jgi:hypothetical protein